MSGPYRTTKYPHTLLPIQNDFPVMTCITPQNEMHRWLFIAQRHIFLAITSTRTFVFGIRTFPGTRTIIRLDTLTSISTNSVQVTFLSAVMFFCSPMRAVDHIHPVTHNSIVHFATLGASHTRLQSNWKLFGQDGAGQKAACI